MTYHNSNTVVMRAIQSFLLSLLLFIGFNVVIVHAATCDNTPIGWCATSGIAPTITSTLQLGDYNNSEVCKAQILVNDIVSDSGYCRVVDGDFGIQTEASVEQVQFENGFDIIDGVIESTCTAPLLLGGSVDPSCYTVPPTPLCTSYIYGSWGICSSASLQTRSVIFSLPSGCSGGVTPITSQSCTYVPPPALCTSYIYGSWGICSSASLQTRSVIASLPSGCSGGVTPVTSQSCTYVPPSPPPTPTCTSFTYTGWGTCLSSSVQTRSVTGSFPTGCIGGTPVTSQSCTYVPPSPPPTPTCTSFTYTAWGTCLSSSVQTRSVTGSFPTGCIGGTPVTSQSCAYAPAGTTVVGNPIATPTFRGFADNILILVMQIGSMVLTIMLIYSGYLFVTGQGNEEKIIKAKTAFKWTLVGGAILIGASAITFAISTTISALL